MAKFPKPESGSWTAHCTGHTDLISYEDSISPEFFELEREAVYRRAWLNVGRVEMLPKPGTFFTKEIDVMKTSLLITRDANGEVHAFHNVCRHRGNRLAWNDNPRGEISGSSRQFTCKFHGWRFGLDGDCTFMSQKQEFFGCDESDFSLVSVHVDVWEGFIFVNFSSEPEQSLREFLGPMITDLDGYPFGKMTDRYSFKADVNANWKVFSDAFMEFYHAPFVHVTQHPSQLQAAIREGGYEAPHYQTEGPHGLITTSGSLHRGWEMPPENVKPADRVTRAGLFGPWETSTAALGELPKGINPAGISPWGLSSFQVFPNFAILVWESGWYNTHQFWPVAHNKMVFEGHVYSLPAKSPAERIGREMAAISFKEYALQDANTLEATQMGLESRCAGLWPLNDQEVLVRHFHNTVGAWVDEYQKEG